MSGKTLYDKLWDAHSVQDNGDGTVLLYVDRHLVHEVTSPQAFDGLAHAGRRLWRTATTIAVLDHNVPTINRHRVTDPIAQMQMDALEKNCTRFNVPLYRLADPRQGIVHIIGPEQGFTLPGMTIVCGDSHTSTHGALGALGFGIGTSDIEHVMASQCLVMSKARNMQVRIEGELGPGVTAKDIILGLIGEIGTDGANGYVIEYAGSTIRNLSMEGRMTICNMTIEAGARAGMVPVDDTTIEYVRDRPHAPEGPMLESAITRWRGLVSDDDASFDYVVTLDAATIDPQVTWGTTPGMVASIRDCIPDPADQPDPARRQAMQSALEYMDLRPGQPIADIPLDKIFIGSCTNARIEDLRAAAGIVRGRKIAPNIKQALVVPGSGLVKLQAEQEGLDRVFRDAGFEWRDAGCSMCLGMNPDQLGPGERCASTSNRNFEGRQGRGGRTHLASPSMVAAAAVHGHFVDLREME